MLLNTGSRVRVFLCLSCVRAAYAVPSCVFPSLLYCTLGARGSSVGELVVYSIVVLRLCRPVSQVEERRLGASCF